MQNNYQERNLLLTNVCNFCVTYEIIEAIFFMFDYIIGK